MSNAKPSNASAVYEPDAFDSYLAMAFSACFDPENHHGFWGIIAQTNPGIDKEAIRALADILWKSLNQNDERFLVHILNPFGGVPRGCERKMNRWLRTKRGQNPEVQELLSRIYIEVVDRKR